MVLMMVVTTVAATVPVLDTTEVTTEAVAETTEAVAETTEAVAETTAASTVPAAAPETLKDLQTGDIACYVVLEGAAGERTLPGDFALCPDGANDATALAPGATGNSRSGVSSSLASTR